MLELNDFGVWKRKHAEAGLVDWTEVGVPKPQSVESNLRAAGWPADRLLATSCDVRDRPRGGYRNSLTLALTDSHATKNGSVLKARQAGSPSLAVGLGSGEAIIECFQPDGPGYCCAHGDEPSWCRRLPCLPNPNVSTTQLAWTASAETVRSCGRLAAGIIAECLATGVFPGGSGLHIHDAASDRFSFGLDARCVGPHDPPFVVGDPGVLQAAAGRGELSLDELLSRVGPGACYADRELGWAWHCPRCGASAGRVHTIHPAASCAVCGAGMQAGLERASGLTAAELADLHHGPLLLTDIGLAEETLLRCIAGSGAVVWIHLEANR
ncbi:MAG: hypothetical protein ABSG86_26235 [Thermoguttaceae bacterium]|jgi:hypothetical protein